MIPLQLKIRNFLSYGTQTEAIDFEPHHLICLTGKNGHGKSALLDAITWAIWGQARKVGGVVRSDEHLLRVGESSMAVTFDFFCNKQRYRVTRDFSIAANKKGVTQLHLGLFKDEIDAYVSLSERNMRDTQEKLDCIVGLTYDTFINSVFLRQGQSNEFSKKSPLERKEILCALLGLTKYEELRKHAIEQQRDYEKEREMLGHITHSLTAEMSTHDEVLAQANKLDTQMFAIENEKQKLIAQLSELSEKQATASQAQTSLALTRQASEQLEQHESKLTTMLATLLKERRAYQTRATHLNAEALAHEHATITARLTAYETLKNRQMDVRENLLRLTTQRQEKLHALLAVLQSNVQATKQALETARSRAEHTQRDLTNLEKKLHAETEQRYKLLEKKQDLAEKLLLHEASTQLASSLEKQIARENRFLERWHIRKQQNDHLYKIACERHQRLMVHDSTCPLCTQSLPEEHRQLLIKTAQKTASRVTHTISRLNTLIKKLSDQIAKHEKALNSHIIAKEAYVKNLQHTVHINEQLANIDHELKHATEERTLLQAAHEQNIGTIFVAESDHVAAIETLTKTPQEDPTLIAYTQEIGSIEKILHDIEKVLASTDPTQLKNNLADIAKKQQDVMLMAHEKIHNQKRRTSIQNTIRELRETTKKQHVLREQTHVLEPLVAELTKNNALQKTTQLKLEMLQNEKQRFSEQKGALARQITILEKRGWELKTHQERINKLDTLIEDHQLLAHALSKNGIQALIIEQAVPELESEANALLAKLTENRAQVMFESLRDLKSGGSKETLDIKISDAMGTRPYELFSGGEAFRIDFALRIALSKLLARRSGTSLQTLIIDEGFGSQDEEGLILIQEALHAIQEDFEKIIVVSHLPAMKHQFPTNFIVHKSTHGSSVSVTEQG